VNPVSQLPVRHIRLEPFDSPTSWRCCAENTCEGIHKQIQRRAGSKDDRISSEKSYLALIHGGWYLGKFEEQWYGWNFHPWGFSGIQLDLIEDLYEIDMGALGE
jgi:hypothetical protein